MSGKKERYFNFPIQLLEGFMIDSKQCLEDISDYSIYTHYINHLEYGEDAEDVIQESASFFKVSLGSKKRTLKNGKILADSLPDNTPTTGLNLSIFWDYFKNDKTDFEKITLLGFLAIKSILQNKSYCKISNNYWLSRMDGKTSSIDEVFELSDEIKKYAVHYQMRKIKKELELNWNLKTVSGRGFNVSFKMSLDSLTYEVFKKRKKYKDNLLKDKKDDAKRKAMERLYGTQPKRNL